MFFNAGFLCLTLLVGSYAFPLEGEQDMSIFFDLSASSSRIVGGTQAGPVPHMVALTFGGIQWLRTLFCGGSLITNRHVLTAAHCIEGAFSWGSLSNTLLGTVGSNRYNSGGVAYAFATNFTHPNYDSTIIKNDIGILVTVNTVVMGNAISVVPLSFDFIGGNVAVRVNGWGRIAHQGGISETLLELRSSTVAGTRCVEDVRSKALELNFTAPAVQPHLEICTFVDETKGNCHGDSGSALVLENGGQQIGVVSWGLPCARGAPDMFARVSAYAPWIRGIIG